MKTIIVEDEKLILEDIKNIIENYSKKIEVVATFNNGVDVLSFLESNDIDVMFVDINIPLLNGMSLAKVVSKFEKKPYIVFITAHKEYAVEAFEIHAFDYVLKPYSVDRIREIINRIEESENTNGNRYNKGNYSQKIASENNPLNKLKVKDKNSINLLELEDVYYLKSQEKITVLHTKDREYEINSCIADVEAEIYSDKFFRCHRSYIVNIDRIKSIESSGVSSYKLKLDGMEDEVPVGRRKIKELKIAMNIE
ncbi:LytR/AlgR family response regulator transcription factor [Romboutsia sp.]|uniref:LytR/AlgR family response regulator transcription factor n=1 Tax=Romboutsia sp. TaxID=1965302 RepID=UPI003F2B79FC